MSEEKEPAMFEPCEIEVAGTKGKRKVLAVTHALLPGIAITNCGFDTYEITHIRTGKRISGNYERFGEAAIVFAQWALITKQHDINWESNNDFSNLFKEIGDSPVPFGFGDRETKQTVAQWASLERSNFLSGYPWEDEHPLDKAGKLLDQVESQ